MSFLGLFLWSLWLQWAQAERAVLVFDDGRVEAVAVSPESTAPERLQGLRSAWRWSLLSPPARVGAADLRQAPERRTGPLLDIVVAARPEDIRRGLRLVAAPEPMWREVQEPLLPSWPVPASGRLSVPLDPAVTWRLRLAGETSGSWWIDLPPGRRQIQLAAVTASPVSVSLVGPEGRPVAPASLRLLEGAPGRGGGEKHFAVYRADAQGRVTIPGLPDQTELTWIAGAPDHPPLTLQSTPGRLPAQLAFSPGVLLTGQARDEHRRPLAGVKVRLQAWIAGNVPIPYSATASTDEEGRFRLAGAPSGQLLLSAQAEGFAPWRQRIEAQGPVWDVGTVVLSRGAALVVKVIDEEGRPVPRAEVQPDPGRRAAADGRGRLTLPHVPPDRFRLAARADGYLPATLDLAAPYPAEARIVLRQAFAVEGRFVDSRGEPLLEAQVRIHDGRRFDSQALEPDGRFRLSLTPGRELALAFRSPESSELRVPLPAGEPGEFRDLGELRAPAAGEITGRLIDAETQEPVAAARIWCPRPGEQGPLLAWMDRDLLETSSRADGTFRLRGVPAGVISLRIEAPRHARTLHTVSLSAEGSILDLGDLVLERGASLRILAGEEAGGGDGTVAYVDLGADRLELDRLSAPVVDGIAYLEKVPAGMATVSVQRGQAILCEKEVQVPEGSPEIEVECLARERVVRGVVEVGGRPAGAGVLSWMPPAGTVPEGINTHVLPGGLRQQRVFSSSRPQVGVPVGADGRFETRDLHPGAWEVLWQPGEGAGPEPQRVVLSDSPEQAVTLRFSGYIVEGRVIDEDGEPVAGARVRETAGGATALSREDGTFSFSGLQAGRRFFEAAFEERASPPAEVLVGQDPPAEPLILTLRAEPRRPSLDFRVAGADGRSAAGAFVFVETPGRGIQVLTADSQGQASMLVTPPYPEAFRAAAFAAGAWAFEGWETFAEGQPAAVLRITGTGALSLTSREVRGEPRIVAPGGWDLSLLLRILGLRLTIAPESPLEVSGLPPGEYEVRLEDWSQRRTVREGEREELRIEP